MTQHTPRPKRKRKSFRREKEEQPVIEADNMADLENIKFETFVPMNFIFTQLYIATQLKEVTWQKKKSALKTKINEITNGQNTRRTYGQPSEKLFPKT